MDNHKLSACSVEESNELFEQEKIPEAVYDYGLWYVSWRRLPTSITNTGGPLYMREIGTK